MKKSGRFIFLQYHEIFVAEFPLFSVAKLSKLKARALCVARRVIFMVYSLVDHSSKPISAHEKSYRYSKIYFPNLEIGLAFSYYCASSNNNITYLASHQVSFIFILFTFISFFLFQGFCWRWDGCRATCAPLPGFLMRQVLRVTG